MREIKFRGIYVDTGEWVYGYLVNIGDEKAVIFDPTAGNIGTYYVVKKETVGQYTGFPDKNGKDIYKGDYVLYPLDTLACGGKNNKTKMFKGLVKYQITKVETKRYSGGVNSGFTVTPLEEIGNYRYGHWGPFYDCEVIGNETETPELLK